MMARRLRSRKGQSILEYLVIVTLVVLAILGIRAVVQQNTDSMLNESANRIGDASQAMTTLGLELP